MGNALDLARTCTARRGHPLETHFRGLCARCDARWIVLQSLDTVDEAARTGMVGFAARDAFRHLWAVTVERDSYFDAWKRPLTDADDLEWLSHLEWAASELSGAISPAEPDDTGDVCPNHDPDRRCVDCATDDQVAAAMPPPMGGAR